MNVAGIAKAFFALFHHRKRAWQTTSNSSHISIFLTDIKTFFLPRLTCQVFVVSINVEYSCNFMMYESLLPSQKTPPHPLLVYPF